MNHNNHGIGCYKNNCYNKLCIPFSMVKGVALKCIGDANWKDSFFEYYSLLFEGIPYIFSMCNCGRVKGYYLQDFCFWCCIQQLR